MEKWEKNHLFWEISRGGTDTKQSGTGTISVLSTGTGTEFPVPVPNVLFWINVSIFAITWSFLIRFECFKCLVKLDFKENKTS